MIQKQLNQLPEQKRNLEFNSMELRNFLEEIPNPVLLTNNKTGQIVSSNSLFSELVNMGYVEIAGSNISEIIPLVDLKNCSDGDKDKTKLKIKNDQSLEVDVQYKFVSQSGDLLLLLFDVDSRSKKAGDKEWENFAKAQGSGLRQIFELSFENLIQKIIDIGKLITFSDEVVFYIFQQGNTFLKRYPAKIRKFSRTNSRIGIKQNKRN